MIHHEDTQAVHGSVQGQGCAGGDPGPPDGCGAGEQARTAPDPDCGVEAREQSGSWPRCSTTRGPRFRRTATPRLPSSMPRSVSLLWSEIFWPKPSIAEPGSEEGNDRNPDHPRLSIVRQCELASISRSSFYREPTVESAATLRLMRLIDEQFLETPWYGSRQMVRHLRRNRLVALVVIASRRLMTRRWVWHRSISIRRPVSRTRDTRVLSVSGFGI